MVLTARAENYLHGRPDLADTIARLQAYQEAGADVLYAPGLTDLADIRSVVESVDRPVNVLALPGGPPVAELAEAGVRRISVGGAFALAAYGALVEAARELLDEGTYGYWERAKTARTLVQEAFKALTVGLGEGDEELDLAVVLDAGRAESRAGGPGFGVPAYHPFVTQVRRWGGSAGRALEHRHRCPCPTGR